MRQPVGAIQIEGRRAVAPRHVFRDTTFYFESTVGRPRALLMATLAVAPEHPLVGPLVENIVQRGRAARETAGGTPRTRGSAVIGASAFDRKLQAASGGPRGALRVARESG